MKIILRFPYASCIESEIRFIDDGDVQENTKGKMIQECVFSSFKRNDFDKLKIEEKHIEFYYLRLIELGDECYVLNDISDVIYFIDKFWDNINCEVRLFENILVNSSWKFP